MQFLFSVIMGHYLQKGRRECIIANKKAIATGLDDDYVRPGLDEDPRHTQ